MRAIMYFMMRKTMGYPMGGGRATPGGRGARVCRYDWGEMGIWS